ncbi:MAG: response regulator [Anaerolineae bacterium]
MQLTVEKTPRVLYIEDDRGLALLLKKRLERQGFTVDLATNGEEGLRLFDPRNHDVIAVDQNMPGLDGLDVIKTLTSYDPIPPIVMITGNGDERVAVEAMKLGARDYIVKDVDGGYLELMPSVLTQLLTHQRLLDEKRVAEVTLRHSEERYRSLVELSPDGIVVNRDDTIVYVNEAAVRLLRANTADDLIGALVSDVLHEECYDAVWTRLQQCRVDGEHVQLLDGKLTRLDGQAVEVEIMAAPIVFENQPATQMILRDVTERRRAEEAQRETEKLRIALEKEKELSDLKTRLMVTISHEFRTPLSIAFSSAELLDKFHEKMKPEQRTDHLHRVEAQIMKITQMIDDVSLVFQSAFERIVLNSSATDFAQLCELAIEHVENDEPTPRIRFSAAPALPTMMIDAARIKYVLTSLLSNAMKYSDQGSTVVLDVDRRGAGVVFHVSDHGIGIPADEQTRIFEPFYRARNVGAIGGTGLGLSIVKDIVDAHHGTMRIDSEVDRGTRISVYLPQG